MFWTVDVKYSFCDRFINVLGAEVTKGHISGCMEKPFMENVKCAIFNCFPRPYCMLWQTTYIEDWDSVGKKLTGLFCTSFLFTLLLWDSYRNVGFYKKPKHGDVFFFFFFLITIVWITCYLNYILWQLSTISRKW